MLRITPIARRGIAVAACAGGVSFAPMAEAQFCGPFTDVPVADAFCSSIQWMFNRGVTLGCTGTLYCPSDLVRRNQMAAFISRLGNVFHQQGGSAFGTTAILGTTDAQRLDIRVNNERVMRYEPNAISPNVIGGHLANNATIGVRGATIAGGGIPVGDSDPNLIFEAPNRVTDSFGMVGGGYGNVAGDDAGTTIDRWGATVAGGRGNVASGAYSAIGGGIENAAADSGAAIAGGLGNVASGFGSVVGGGYFNTASGNTSAVLGGALNQAAGNYSFAMGRRALALGNGSFSFADTNDFDFSSATENVFRVRATGGVRFVVDIDGNGAQTWACFLVSGAGWNCASDRNLKQDLEPLDGTAVLDKLAAMPVYAWRPKGHNAHVRHFGPMAQDFHAAFGLGDDDKSIGMQDADGVALAAIQGLNAKLEARVAEQSREIAALRERLDALIARLDGGAEAPR